MAKKCLYEVSFLLVNLPITYFLFNHSKISVPLKIKIVYNISYAIF